MINTFKETSLHKTLKNLYARSSNGKTEIPKDGMIYDIYTEEGNIIEIQTQNLSKLLPKILKAHSLHRKCTVVYPLSETKIITYKDKEGNTLSRRKSPKNKTIYDIFKELTGLYPILLDKKFILEVVFTTTEEIRTKTEEKIQSENKKRRFKKDWNKTDKKLIEIRGKRLFSKRQDYLSLLPENLPTEFSVKDVKESLKTEGKGNNILKNVPIMIWVLCKMNLIIFTGKKGNLKLYKISDEK